MSDTEKYWVKIGSICAVVTICGSVFVTCVLLLIKGVQYIDTRAANDAEIRQTMAQHTEALKQIGWTQWNSPIYMRLSSFDEWGDDMVQVNPGLKMIHTKDLSKVQSVYSQGNDSQPLNPDK